MKKYILGGLVTLLLFVISSYLFVPNIISISNKLSVHTNAKSFYRGLFDKNKWPAWWPGEHTSTNKETVFSYKGTRYRFNDIKFSSLIILADNNMLEGNTSLNYISANPDSVDIVWEAKIPTSYNPLKRWQVYFNSKKLASQMNKIMGKASLFYTDPKNIYGIDIKKERVVDSLLMSTFSISKGSYPGVNEIYSLVDELKKYIASNGAKETGIPMLNISTADSISYTTRVAIPVDKKLPSSGNISFKWMLGGGNILTADVKGGNEKINRALYQIDLYIEDYNRKPPAISFLSLITDRRKEPDSSKWITRIYYPVM
jgi:hypothetical protein